MLNITKVITTRKVNNSSLHVNVSNINFRSRSWLNTTAIRMMNHSTSRAYSEFASGRDSEDEQSNDGQKIKGAILELKSFDLVIPKQYERAELTYGIQGVLKGEKNLEEVLTIYKGKANQNPVLILAIVLSQKIGIKSKAIIEELLKKGVGLDVTDEEGNTVGHYASWYGAENILKELRDRGYYRKEAVNKYGMNILHAGVMKGNARILNEIFISGNLDFKGQAKYRGYTFTPIEIAVAIGNIGMIEVLWNMYKDIQAKSEWCQENILNVAIACEKSDVLDYLIYNEKYNFKWQDIQNSFVYSAKIGNIEAMSILQKSFRLEKYKSASIKRIDSKNGNETALHVAVREGNIDVINYLLRQDRRLVNMPDGENDAHKQKTPIELAKELIRKGDNKETYERVARILSQTSVIEETREHELPKLGEKPIKNLVWKGGGPKGIGLLGGIEEFERIQRELKWGAIERVAGTSAGAIIAALYAVGYNAKELQEELQKKSIKDFIDSPNQEVLLKLKDKKVNNILSSIWNNKGSSGNRLIFELINCLGNKEGLCAGNNFEEYIGGLIYKKTGKKNFTFGELAEKVKSGIVGYKDLYIVSVDISILDKSGKEEALLIFNSEDESFKDISISEAVRASMSIPVVFEPKVIKYRDRVTGEYKEYKCIDGGAVWNYPISIFDKAKFKYTGLRDKGEKQVYNEYTLGFSLTAQRHKIEEDSSLKAEGIVVKTEACDYNEELWKNKVIKSVGKYLFEKVSGVSAEGVQKDVRKIKDEIAKLFTLFTYVEMISNKHWKEGNKVRTINISDCGVGMLDFDLTAEKIKELLETGREAVKEKFESKDKSDVDKDEIKEKIPPVTTPSGDQNSEGKSIKQTFLPPIISPDLIYRLQKNKYLLLGFAIFLATTAVYIIYTNEDEKEKAKRKDVTPEPRDYAKYVERKGTYHAINEAFVTLESKQRVAIILLVGAQGSGKSELAEEYADRYIEQQRKRLDHVQTVVIFRAEHKEDFKREYREFAEKIIKNSQDCSDERLIKEVNKELSNRDNWLLVFDNIKDEKHYNFISKFIPQGRNLEGRVILTARDNKILPDRERYHVKVMDITKSEYRFHKDEAIKLVDMVLGNNHPEYHVRKGQKDSLAETLGYLPHAIKKAAAYIKNYPTTIIDYTNNIQAEIGISGNYSIEDYNKVNKMVNKLSIYAISSNQTVIAILNFISFLNPDIIQKALLKKKLKVGTVKGVTEADFADAFELLEGLFILEGKGRGIFKLHRSLSDEIKETIPEIEWLEEQKKIGNKEAVAKESYTKVKTEREKIFIQEAFNEVLNFVSINFKRNNVNRAALENNALFIPHIKTITKYQKDIEEKTKTITSEIYFFNVAMASYYMMTGRSFKAQELLLNNKKALEEVLGDDLKKLKTPSRILILGGETGLSLTKIKEIKAHLETQYPAQEVSLLTIYAQTLYHLGRTYFDIGETPAAGKEQYKEWLFQAVQLREVIDLIVDTIDPSKKEQDIRYNEYNLDSILVERNGTLEFLRRTSTNREILQNVCVSYDRLIEKAKKDLLNIESCRSEKFRVRQKIALQKKDDEERKELCDEAVREIYGNYIAKGDINYSVLFEELTKPQNDTRQAKYLNDMGKLLFIRGGSEEDLKLAGRFYAKSIEIEENQGKISIDLSAAYLGRAMLHCKLQEPESAKLALMKCRELQKKLFLHKQHPQVEEAEALEKHMGCLIKRILNSSKDQLKESNGIRL